jgi:threonylcarbamoyladenosine tRNA methylthiotransferase MtaB
MHPEKTITFSIHTIGCKTNQAESDEIANQLVLRGCRQAETSDAAGTGYMEDNIGTADGEDAASTADGEDAASATRITDSVGITTDAGYVACASGVNSGIDYIIINTCTVTSAADRKVRHLIRKLKGASPKAKLIITGCFAELHNELTKDIPADFIFSNNGKKEIVDFICGAGLANEKPATEAVPAAKTLSTADSAFTAEQKAMAGNAKESAKATSTPVAAVAATSSLEAQYVHSRAFVKIQDGCNQGCTYCIVPLARGTYLSTDPLKIIGDIKRLVSLGHEEIVLTGIHIGKFGVDLLSKKGEIKTLPGLVLEILKNTYVKRLRLSSIEINEIDESLLGVIRNNRPRIVPHLHIPLQSGSDYVLKAMNRKYDSGFYISAVEHIKKAVPDITLTTDIIAGFPGETVQDFIDTVEMVKKVDFSKIHVFKYSIRPGTKAAGMAGQVQEKTKTERSLILRELGLDLRKSFIALNILKKLDVVCEEYDIKSNIASGTSENYIKVYFDLGPEGFKLKKGKILKILAKSLYADGLYGDL